MHFFRQIKISISLFFDTLFRKYIIIIQNTKYQEITIAKSTRKTVRRDAATGCFVTR